MPSKELWREVNWALMLVRRRVSFAVRLAAGWVKLRHRKDKEHGKIQAAPQTQSDGVQTVPCASLIASRNCSTDQSICSAVITAGGATRT